jgi:hypothetical protein
VKGHEKEGKEGEGLAISASGGSLQARHQTVALGASAGRKKKRRGFLSSKCRIAPFDKRKTVHAPDNQVIEQIDVYQVERLFEPLGEVYILPTGFYLPGRVIVRHDDRCRIQVQGLFGNQAGVNGR